MKYLALENTETKKEWLEVESIDNSYIFVSENDFEAWYSDDSQPEENIDFSEVDFSEGSFISIQEENGNIENYRVVEFETSKAEDLVHELNYFSISAKKANTTDSVYIELDSEIEGFDNIRISNHDANGKHSTTLEIDITKIDDILDFCAELEQFISWEDLELLEQFIYKA